MKGFTHLSHNNPGYSEDMEKVLFTYKGQRRRGVVQHEHDNMFTMFDLDRGDFRSFSKKLVSDVRRCRAETLIQRYREEYTHRLQEAQERYDNYASHSDPLVPLEREIKHAQRVLEVL